MSLRMWLIVEADKDGLICQTIFRKLQPDLHIQYRKPSGARGGISRLASQLDRLIEEALHQQPAPDCIVVLHDADELTQRNRSDYERIVTICRQYEEIVTHLVAHDEIEAWLLADKALCRWLQQKPDNHDHRPDPKAELIRWLKRENKPSYTDANLRKLIRHVDATGHEHSPSMKAAIQSLRNSGCL